MLKLSFRLDEGEAGLDADSSDDLVAYSDAELKSCRLIFGTFKSSRIGFASCFPWHVAMPSP